MRTYDITFTASEAYTVMDILNDYIKKNQKDANDETKSETYREVSHECAVEVSRIRNRMRDKVVRW